VLVTGAGGSIGSELCRQVARFAPSRLVLVERSEAALFDIERRLREQWRDLPIEAFLADAGDTVRMSRILALSRPAVLFHAAAHKHVVLSETNVCEAVKSNVLATQRLGRLAGESGVGAFVILSTDKAVRPVSVMGATKRVAELVLQRLHQEYTDTRYVAVRFGNVMGSTGSVIPIFREQIAAGGPVTVTHPDATRYFMTIPEAVQLVLEAGAIGSGGDILVLDMGKPIRIVDLAHDMIRLSGLRPDKDIEVVFTGLRPGERLNEDLGLEAAEARTRHPKILVGRLGEPDLRILDQALAALGDLAAQGADEESRCLLETVVARAAQPAPVSDVERPVASARVLSPPAWARVKASG
jgi:FlaA1/EpsC-like NDP-sugar epimerase